MPFITKFWFWSLSWLDAPRWWETSPVSVGSSHHPRASCCLCGGLSALPQFPWIKKLTVFAVKFTSALLQDVPALELFHSASDSSWPYLNVNRNLKVNKITVLYLVHIYNRFYGCCVQLITLSTLSPEYRSDRSTFERALCFMLYSFNILVVCSCFSHIFSFPSSLSPVFSCNNFFHFLKMLSQRRYHYWWSGLPWPASGLPWSHLALPLLYTGEASDCFSEKLLCSPSTTKIHHTNPIYTHKVLAGFLNRL